MPFGNPMHSFRNQPIRPLPGSQELRTPFGAGRPKHTFDSDHEDYDFDGQRLDAIKVNSLDIFKVHKNVLLFGGYHDFAEERVCSRSCGSHPETLNLFRVM
jgi:hypothetical protein